MDELKKRPSFGQNASLGSLYSFQNEHLYPDISVFERKLPDEFQAENKITDSDGKKVATTFENTTSKKLSLLNIETDVKLSVLCGMLTSNETNFMEHKELGNRGICFYAYTLEISFQSFDANDKNLQNLCKKMIESEKADHVIVGITYGNQIIVKLTFDNSAKEMDDKELLQEKIGKDFDNLLQLNDIGGIENYDQWFTYLPSLKFEIFSDLLNTESKTVEDFCNKFQQIKTDSKKVENVKQLYFHLMPISTFQEKTGCKFSETPIFNSITEKTMSKNIEPAFDKFDNAICQLYALKNNLENHRNYVTLKEMDSLNERITKFETEDTEFKRKLRDEIIEYRSSHDPEEVEIIVRCRNFLKICETTEQEIMKQFEIVKQRINYLNQIAKLGLTIVRDLHEFEYIKTEKKEIYLLSFAFSQFNQSSELEENYSYFCSLYNDRKRQTFIGTSPTSPSPHHLYPSFLVVEYDIFPEIFQAENLSTKPQISKIVDGKFAETNLLESKVILESQCIVKCDNIVSTGNNSQHYKRQIVKIRCPNTIKGGKCSNKQRYWYCSKCCAPLEYGFDGRFYCVCGFQNCENFEFKCNEKDHRNGFVKFNKEDLKRELSNTSEREEINIVMLGESGVGKSTLINSIAMYLTFDTLDEAKSPGSNLIALVPTKFSFQDSSNGQDFSIPVSTGSSKNECQESGKSSTRTCRAYHIPYGDDKIIRIIDTPGILDTDGMEQDKKNLENTLNFLDKYDEIHAICILCSANCAKLSKSFEYCFKELFTQFHISAAKNFVFIFTKAAQSGYQAGDTIDYIEKLLKEIKAKRPGQKFDINAKGLAFNFDNMGYRYLCALQENRTLKIDQEPKYEESYRRARDETIRLLQHIKTTKPHNAADSVSIFRARNLTFRLTKPLIKIGQTQKESIIKRQRRQREIQKAANDLEKLRKILATKAPTIHWSIVKQTIDVCANCTTIKEYRGNERIQFLECIPHACDIDPFSLQLYHRLKKSVDGKFKCKNCGPLYIYHQIHEYLLRREEYDTKDIETSIAKKLTTKEEIEQQIKQEAQELLEIEEEIAIVINSTAKFYAYLKAESVISHNDAADTYIDVLIKCEENGKCDSDKLQSLNDLKIMLQKEKERLDEVSPITQEKLYRVTPEDVLDLVTKLESLKHYGPDVKRAMEEKIEKRDAITEEPYISYLNQYSHNKNKIKHCIEEFEKQ